MLKWRGLFMAIIQSIERAFFLLELLAEGSDFCLADLSRRSGLKAPTCRNILSTLISLGYVSQHSHNRHYFLSGKAAFGHEQRLESSLIQQSLPILQDLVQRCSETIILCRYRNARRKTLLALESQQALRVTAQEGEDERFFATATGRILLSQVPENELCRLLKNQNDLDKQWPEMAQSASKQEFLQKIRQDGFLIFNRDNTVQALSVPINFPKASLFAAIGMYYPSARHSPAELPSLIEQLKKAAKAISLLQIP